MDGMLTVEELGAAAAAGDIATVAVAFPDHYGRLMGKRFDAAFFVEEVAAAGTHACDYLLTTDMEMEPVTGYAFANWDLGYGDVHLVPDLATLRRAAWSDAAALVLCDVETDQHEPVAVAPRTTLARQVAALAQVGLTAKAASELEYFVFEDTFRAAATKEYRGLEPAGWYREDYHLLQGAREERFNAPVRRYLGASGIPVENSKGEWGHGQHEMNIRYADLADMADRHAVMKLAMKEIADQLGMSITFMAKPFTGQAGSSSHLHVSLWRDGENVFASGGAEFDGFLAGILRRLPEIAVLVAPTVNSYKRFEDGSWAPTRLAWSRDNRTAALRVIGTGPASRVEVRVPGADCNPYLAYSGVLAAGLEGMRDGLGAPPEFRGDAYAAGELPRLPATLREAAELFATSAFAASALGPEVHDHYTHFYRSEAAAFESAVTDWERHRYFERI